MISIMVAFKKIYSNFRESRKPAVELEKTDNSSAQKLCKGRAEEIGYISISWAVCHPPCVMPLTSLSKVKGAVNGAQEDIHHLSTGKHHFCIEFLYF